MNELTEENTGAGANGETPMHGGGVAPDSTKQKNDEQRCTILSLPSSACHSNVPSELPSWGGVYRTAVLSAGIIIVAWRGGDTGASQVELEVRLLQKKLSGSG
jgi:hypothetical protein